MFQVGARQIELLVKKDVEVVIYHFTSFARLSLQWVLSNYLCKVFYIIQVANVFV